MTLMTTSQRGIDLIKGFEDCKLYSYRDSAGVATIGYGHTKGVKMGMAITQAEADKFLVEDLKVAESVLNRMEINFTQNQFDALVSWVFNIGESKFNSSTLKKKIIANASDCEITDQIVKWVNSGGKPLKGLKKRRCAEANMFLGQNRYYIDTNGNIAR